MKVLTAETIGCCAGVKNALRIAKNFVEKKSAACTFGQLIHNPNLTHFLECNGIFAIDEGDLPKLKNAHELSIVIRAHGISPAMQRKIEDTGAKIIDATCARVKKNQMLAAKFAKSGRAVILAGEKNHAELLGIAGFVEENFCDAQNCGQTTENACFFVESVDEAEHFAILPKKAALICQTTICEDEYKKISAALAKKIPDLIVCDTLCDATKMRQNALLRLCEKCDAIVVVGGKNSANTKKLAGIAKMHCKNVFFVENAAELPLEKMNFACVGITAGTSTMDETIDEVRAALERVGGER